MITHYYSDFWLIDRGVLSLPGWKHKGYEREPVAEPLPSVDELEQYARLPFAERQALELALGGEIVTTRRDMIDTRAKKYAAKRAAQAQQRRAA